jgi:hypothetical protein
LIQVPGEQYPDYEMVSMEDAGLVPNRRLDIQVLRPYNDMQAAFATSLEAALENAGVQGDVRRGRGEIATDAGAVAQLMPPKFWDPRRRNTIVFLFRRRESELCLRLAFTLEETARWAPTLKISYLMVCSDGTRDLLVVEETDKTLPAVESSVQYFVADLREISGV